MAKKEKKEFRDDLPHDIEVEQQVLGWCLRDNVLIDEASASLEPEDFFDPFHQRVFEMMGVLRTDGDVTVSVLSSVMRTDPAFGKDGLPPDYLKGLRLGSDSTPSFKEWVSIIRETAQRRRMVEIGERLIEDARAGRQFGAAAAKVAEQATDDLAGIAASAKGGKHRRGIPVYEALDKLMRDIESQANAETPIAIPTGLPRLDNLLGGLLPGRFYVVGARPGMGKSILATNLAKAAARAMFPADYYSGEMGAEEIAARLGCDIDFDRCFSEKMKPLVYQHFVNMKAGAQEIHRLAEARVKLAELPIEFFDAGRLSIEYINATARRRHRLNPVRRLILVDHLQKVHWEGKPRDASRVQEISEITGQLVTLAKDTGASIVALSQLSRDLENRDDKHPRQPDFRDGGSVEQDADVLIGLYRPMRYAVEKIRQAKNEEQRLSAIAAADDAKGKLEIGILKQRAGAEVDYFPVFIEEKAAAVRDEEPIGVATQDLFF